MEELHSNQAPASSSPQYLTAFQDQILFAAATTEHGVELWKSDGTEQGTVLVKDIVPGEVGSSPTQFIRIGEEVYFATHAEDSSTLWKTDGTEIGTLGVAEFDAISQLIVHDERLMLAADGQLWESDGTSAGTRLVSVASEYDNVWTLTVFDNSLVFTSDHDGQTGLWRLKNGSISLVAEGDVRNEFVEFRGELYFITGFSDVEEQVLWKSDGTPNGTTAVFNAQYIDMIAAKEAVLLRVPPAPDETSGRRPQQIWRTDGTAAGTSRILFPGAEEFEPSWFIDGVDRVFISTSSDGEMWSSDGSQEGTSRIESIHVSSRVVSDTSVIAGEQFLFGAALWRTDGTEPGTIKISDVGGPKYSAEVLGVGDTLFFNGVDDSGSELWKSDGTPEGTQLVKDINPGFRFVPDDAIGSGRPQEDPRDLTPVGGELFFTHKGLRVTDGTVNETKLLTDTYPVNLTDYNGNALFHDYVSLWTSDGSVTGTQRFFEFDGDRRLPSRTPFTQLGGDIYFFVDGEKQGRELWRTDGTFDGTTLVSGISTDIRRNNLEWIELVALHDQLFLSSEYVGISGTLGFRRNHERNQ